MSDNFETLLYKKTRQIVTITLDRPDKANGLNTLMAEELAEAAQKAQLDFSVKAVILTGSGRFFCAGGDVKSISLFGDSISTDMRYLADQLHRAITIFSTMKCPVVVAVNGTAAGAGFGMAIMGDMVIAAESASFTMAYSKVGLSPDGGSSHNLPRLIGLRKTQELMYTNRTLSAQDALDWGLINRVVADDQLLDEANALAELFVNGSSGSNRAIKQLLLHSSQNDLNTQMELEAGYITDCASSHDGIEGVDAFLNKRTPNFL